MAHGRGVQESERHQDPRQVHEGRYQDLGCRRELHVDAGRYSLKHLWQCIVQPIEEEVAEETEITASKRNPAKLGRQSDAETLHHVLSLFFEALCKRVILCYHCIASLRIAPSCAVVRLVRPSAKQVSSFRPRPLLLSHLIDNIWLSVERCHVLQHCKRLGPAALLKQEVGRFLEEPISEWQEQQARHSCQEDHLSPSPICLVSEVWHEKDEHNGGI
mmetsp:Transcript_15660/g.36695  ORF Transcript_15660/g.36695 Transcript_15660/m.36695 type:complete len:217 (+) Transcript_15660:595-1245(+)